jgi:thiosulfate/3-mercaptopyruvate sulfurtransferase
MLGFNVDNYDLYLFCGTGWRASEVYFYLMEFGLKNIYIFNGWFEWSSLKLPSSIINT